MIFFTDYAWEVIKEFSEELLDSQAAEKEHVSTKKISISISIEIENYSVVFKIKTVLFIYIP